MTKNPLTEPSNGSPITSAVTMLTPLLVAFDRSLVVLDRESMASPKGSTESMRLSREFDKAEAGCHALENATMRLPAQTITDCLVLVTLASSYTSTLRAGGCDEKYVESCSAMLDDALRSVRHAIEAHLGVTAHEVGLDRYLYQDEKEDETAPAE